MVVKIDSPHDDVLNDIGELMVLYRRVNGLTQSELADKIGISRSQLGNIERGFSKGSNKTFLALLNIMGISIVPIVHKKDKTEERPDDTE